MASGFPGQPILLREEQQENRITVIANNNKTDINSCCGCEKEVLICLKEPVVSLDIFDFLADTRPLTLNNTPDQNIPLKPTVKSTILTFKSYIKNQIDGNNRNINIRNRNFTDKIGLDFAR